ncbi:unnamed protein product, partial [Anisakis simplex]|uniref:Merozoite surface protein 3 n=1 Tax=Anisakis simplex TaxID=6269 RepID=A0A0M3JHZ0_ANISI
FFSAAGTDSKAAVAESTKTPNAKPATNGESTAGAEKAKGDHFLGEKIDLVNEPVEEGQKNGGESHQKEADGVEKSEEVANEKKEHDGDETTKETVKEGKSEESEKQKEQKGTEGNGKDGEWEVIDEKEIKQVIISTFHVFRLFLIKCFE